MYRELFSSNKLNEEKLKKVEPITGTHYEYHAYLKNDEFFINEKQGLTEKDTFWVTALKVQDKTYIFSCSGIVRVFDKNGILVKGYREYVADEEAAEEIESIYKSYFVEIGESYFSISHYDYLELVIDHFWKKVFGKTTSEMWMGGIITSHGDKAYGYKNEWKKSGIKFRRGMLLFLLTYTKLLGDRPKYESLEWTIENYSQFLPMIIEAENQAGLDTE